MANRKDHLDLLAIGLLVILCASWGVHQVVIKISVPDVSPVMQSAIRSLGATVLVWLWMAYKRQPLFERDGTFWWGLTAGLLFGFEFMLLYWGLEYTNASRAIIFLYLSPFVVAVGAHYFIPGEKIRLIQIIGLICAFTGLLAAFGDSLGLPDKRMLIGDLMLVAAAILWGATTVVIKMGPLAGIAPGKTLLYQLGVSAMILPLGSFILGEPGIVRLSSVAIISLLYQTVWVASVTYLAWFWLIRHYPASKLTSLSFLTPLFGVLAGVAILDEPLTYALLLAMVLVAAGVYLVNRKPKTRAVKLATQKQ